jgi:hypothetical protein
MMKKSSVMILCLAFAMLFAISVVSADQYFYPVSGIDNTAGTSTSLNNLQLGRLNSSNDAYYTTTSGWDSTYNAPATDYLEFVFNTSLINVNAALNTVTLTVEWRRNSPLAPTDVARLQIWDSSLGNWVEYQLNNPTTNNDLTETVAISNIDSITKLNNIRVRFQATSSTGLGDTSHDLVRLNVNYTLPIIANPTCTVDYLRGINGNSYNYNLSQTLYLNQTGYYDIYGYNNAGHSQCSVMEKGYSRTSPSPFLAIAPWEPAAGNSGSSIFMNFNWHTTAVSYNSAYTEGNHTVCCEVVSAPCHDGNCQRFSNESCTTFCIDTQKPVITEIRDNTFDCDNTATKYWNGDTILWNWTVNESGCAGIDYYNVTLYDSEGNFVGAMLETTNSFQSFGGFVDGESYYISVVAVDNAGNVADTVNSSIVTIDTADPIITFGLIHPLVFADSTYWATSGFYVPETDSDINLLNNSCRIVVADNGNITMNESVVCNSEHYVANDKCMTDGYATCQIWKSAKDKACNVGEAYTSLHVDKTKPNTTKTAQGNVYGDGINLMNLTWNSVQYMIHYFLGAKPSALRFECSDSASGCNYIYGIVTNASGVVATFNETITPVRRINLAQLVNFVDGVYNVTYYSVDNVGHQEVIQSELDKVDTLGPVTVKTIGEPKYNGTYFITNHTPMTLIGTDSEVGCNITGYRISDSEHVRRMSSDYEDCNVSVDWTGLEDGVYTIEFESVDHLDNVGNTTTQNHYLDNSPPLMRIVNPSFSNTSSCSMAVLAEILDSASGINESTVKVSLFYENGSLALTKALPRTGNLFGAWWGGKPYSTLLNTTGLASGVYTLVVSGADNLGNLNDYTSKTIILNDGIYVEYVSPSSCSIVPGHAGNCSFTFNTCIRDSDSVSMWMDKLNGGKVSPTDVDATLWNALGQSQEIGVIENGVIEFNPEPLRLNVTNSCQNYNGWYQLNMTLNVPAEFSSLLGGKYTINYNISSFDEYSCGDEE